MIKQLRPLTQEQRQFARQAAHQAVVQNDMSIEDWRFAVTREMQAERWYEIPGLNREKLISFLEVDGVPTRRNGHNVLPKVSAALESGTV